MPLVPISIPASAGDQTVIAADPYGRRQKVKALVLVAAGAVSVTFKDGTTALSGRCPWRPASR